MSGQNEQLREEATREVRWQVRASTARDRGLGVGLLACAAALAICGAVFAASDDGGGKASTKAILLVFLGLIVLLFLVPAVHCLSVRASIWIDSKAGEVVRDIRSLVLRARASLPLDETGYLEIQRVGLCDEHEWVPRSTVIYYRGRECLALEHYFRSHAALDGAEGLAEFLEVPLVTRAAGGSPVEAKE